LHMMREREMAGSETERADDARFMDRALALAENGLGLAAPNPMVGALVVAGGEIVGEGWHEGPGTPHAEVVALRGAGERARGATLYTTLEPCSHQGRTPPCAPAVARAGVGRAVIATRDPNPVVDGNGVRMLREAGVAVEEGVLAAHAKRLIEGFTRHVTSGLPFVTLKMAASLDGKVAARDGSSRWITGEAAREDVHLLRAASGAIVVGAGTVLADDPSLTVRLPGYRGRPPLRVAVDAVGRISSAAALFDDAAPTLIATVPRVDDGTRNTWEAAGAEVLVLSPGPAEDRVPVQELIEVLGKRDIQTVLIEGGPTLAWSALEAGVVDRFVLYLAPKLVGGADAPGTLGGGGIRTIAESLPAEIVDVQVVGNDLKVVADVHRDR
jgi:diaminohydroxyphosphoribosylaminopyrimidine deaminase / 5-amino-6-(5-phosphoribosylamino)uracil reductase